MISFYLEFCGPKKGLMIWMGGKLQGTLCPLASNTTGQLDVLGHNGNSLSVDGTQVGILKEPNQVGFGCLLQGHHSRGLEPKVCLEVLGNFTNEPLEGKLTDEELSALLISSNFPQGYSTWPVAVGFLNTSCGWGRLSCSLGGKLFARSLPSS